MTGAAEWRGRVGESWAREWARTDRSLAGLAPLLDAAIRAAAPAGPFAALEIGAGAGATTLALARARPDARVIAAELAPGLATVARERLAGCANARVATGDALTLAAGEGPFDLLLSRHGVMFFPDPVAAFGALRAATVPGGRLVFSCFAERAANPWATLLPAGPAAATGYRAGPFAFADPGFVAALLAQAGWRDAAAERVEFGYVAGAGDDPLGDAADFLSRIGPAASLLRDSPPDAHARLQARLRSALAAFHHGQAVTIPATAWIWTARAP